MTSRRVVRGHSRHRTLPVKLLGVDIDDKLNFRKHIQTMCRKAEVKLNAIKRLASHLNQNDRKLLVDAHVISQFNYSSTV